VSRHARAIAGRRNAERPVRASWRAGRRRAPERIIELDASELVEGTNVVEFQGSGTWTGAYRMAVVGVDLVLATAP
jgi:hypothetical protein